MPPVSSFALDESAKFETKDFASDEDSEDYKRTQPLSVYDLKEFSLNNLKVLWENTALMETPPQEHINPHIMLSKLLDRSQLTILARIISSSL